MSIYIIGDLHLSFSQNKPMSIFGDNWENHEEKIRNNWINIVKEDDTVILAGDFSWATYLNDTYKDFEYINNLPGKKLFLKGNHDYWWETVSKMKKYLKENEFNEIDFIYNNAHVCEEYIIAGTRGYTLGGDESDDKILRRELLRLEISLEKAKEFNSKLEEQKEIIVIMHYPPITDKNEQDTNKFIELMKKYNVKKCYYGHLHGPSINNAVEGNINGINIELISADKVKFELQKVSHI